MLDPQRQRNRAEGLAEDHVEGREEEGQADNEETLADDGGGGRLSAAAAAAAVAMVGDVTVRAPLS
jgi:hypothetical protein